MDIRLRAADTIIFFDYPRTVCLWRVLKRNFQYLGRSRPDMAVGCPERIDWDFLRWIWTYAEQKRPGVVQKLQTYSQGRTVVALHNDGEAQRFLRSVEPHPQEI